MLIMHTASLELAKHEYIELAPVTGMCGPCKLSGNSLPVFEYRVFDPRKKPFMMEFVKVRVEVSKPDRIQFIAKIDSEGSVDHARHGEEVEALPMYREPFYRLATHLFRYFPYFVNPKRDPNRFDQVKSCTTASA